MLSLEILEEAGVSVRTVSLRVPDQTIEVAHCDNCGGLTFDPVGPLCGCGDLLNPGSRTITLGSTDHLLVLADSKFD
jgi:hypothetical protein